MSPLGAPDGVFNPALSPSLDFPSPASAADSLRSPPLVREMPSGFQSGLPTTPWTPDAARPLPSEPSVAYEPQPLKTPPPTQCPSSPDLNIIVGGALAPLHTANPRCPPPKRGPPDLRLPSFEMLGIAAPHPDRFGQNILTLDGSMSPAARSMRIDTPRVAGSALLEAFNQLHVDSPSGSRPTRPHSSTGRALSGPVKQFISTITPPAEAGEPSWPSLAASTTAPMESPLSDPDLPASSPGPLPTSGAAAPAITETAPTTMARVESNTTQQVHHTEIPQDEHAWIEDAIEALLESLRTAALPANPLRVLSHALPSPSATGHVFPTVLNAIHDSTPTSPTVWINVFHAIPGRFNLADLPTSPPATPGPPVGGEDYFTTKTFDSAVPISDYQEDLSSLPRSPRPVVPPSSINVAIVERYIPPTSLNEFADMSNPNGPSVLIDRLVELSPQNGCLVFIYPTKTGAQTFREAYLEPILAPLLRSLCVTHGLSFDLSRALGSMPACDRLQEFHNLQRQMSRVCSNLSQHGAGTQRFHGRRARYTLAYAAAKEVFLARTVWAKDWWTKQEKPRIREIVTRYAQEAQKKSSNEHIDRPATSAELIQQLLDGVINKPYPEGMAPKGGIEVGVFVIKRADGMEERPA